MQKMRVLYAEDDMVRANLVKLQVEGAGFALRIVTDGRRPGRLIWKTVPIFCCWTLRCRK